MEVGRVVYKIAGRDAGKAAAIVDVIDSNNVLIDGQTRRRKVSIRHIELTKKTVKIAKNDSTDKVVAALKEAGFEFEEKKQKKSGEKKAKPASTRAQKASAEKPKAESKPKKKTAKKATKKASSKKSSKKE